MELLNQFVFFEQRLNLQVIWCLQSAVVVLRNDSEGVGHLRQHVDGLATDRWNRLNPGQPPRVAHVAQLLPSEGGQIVIATDWIRAYPDLVAPWLPASRIVLGTDGFGRSDTREALRRLFAIDAPHIAAAAFVGLARQGLIPLAKAEAAIRELGVDASDPDPMAL